MKTKPKYGSIDQQEIHNELEESVGKSTGQDMERKIH